MGPPTVVLDRYQRGTLVETAQMNDEIRRAMRRLEEDVTQLHFLEEQCRNTRQAMERHLERLRSALEACGAAGGLGPSTPANAPPPP